MQKGFLLEVERCVGCFACQVACKTKNDTEVGPLWRRVTEIESGKYPETTRRFVSMACMHCGEPACVAVCPAGALSKRAEDGIVVVDQNKCIGCHYCFFACPFGVPQYGSSGTMQKCDLCLDRLEEGKEPACVATCLGKAIHAGTMQDLSKFAQQKVAKKLAGSTVPSVLISK